MEFGSQLRFHRGILYIYNVYFYANGNNRTNSEKDVRILRETFRGMNADVIDLSDDTPGDIKINQRSLKNDGLTNLQRISRKMEAVSKKDFSGYTYVAVAVLAHGTNDGLVKLYGRNEECSLEKTFLEPLIKNNSLQGKLKWIIAAPCRGPSKTFEPYSASSYEMPIENSHFYLITYSTTEDCVAKRYEDGNLFIQALCAILKARKHQADIFTIFNEVAALVEKSCSKIKKSDKNQSGENNKYVQLPARKTNLPCSCVFFKNGEDDPFYIPRVWE